MKFNAIIERSGKTATGLQVPPEVIASLGSGKRPAVRVTINGYTYRSTVAPMGGGFMLPVSAEVRERATVAAGDTVEVEIALDTEPRTIGVPPDLQSALDQDTDVKRRFESLSYSHKLRYVLSVEDAKTAETRQRRIAKTVDELRQGGLV